ncbi:hypothetical protein RIF29_39015 [Crotalaria pallida]|uniref:MORF/ORRM1/DAG-like MORF domain-containing protein n=1 Tax=Crotalaria pallida TaxID=3830 RepID=A0AAN9E2V8_CROPI
MATHIFFSRVLPKSITHPSLFSRTTTTTLSFLRHLRPLSATTSSLRLNLLLPPSSPRRSFSTRATSSSLNDPNPNFSNRPPKETILLDGCDFEHWLVVMETPEADLSRDEIIDSYIKTLAQVVGSEQEARMKIYSVSTRHYYAFGALVSEELSYKLKELPKVRWVLPDSYLNVKEKDYGGEPFINGQAVPYDPKYHEEWVRNNARANERNRRNDRPRNADRSRNFERRREDVVSRDMQKPGSPPPGNAGGLPSNNTRGYAPPSGYTPPNNTGRFPPQNAGTYAPHHSSQGNYPPLPPPPLNSGYAPPGGVPQNNYPSNQGGVPPNQNMGGVPTNAGWSNTAPNRDYQPPNMGGPAGGNPYTS